MQSTKLILALALGLASNAITRADDPAPGPQHPGRPGAIARGLLLKKFDADGDQQLSEAERAAAIEQFKTNHPDLFAKADTNGDGKLSMEERIAARRAIWRHVLAKFDTDGDGKLNEQERQSAKAAILKRLGGPAAK